MDETLKRKSRLGFPGLRWAAVLMMISFATAGWAAQVGSAATQTALAISTSDGAGGSIATLTADVAALNETGSAAPSGVVTFRSGNRDLGSAVVDAEGKAVLKTGSLAPGPNQVVAVYQGDGAYAASISPSSELDASAPPVAGFDVSATPSSLKTAVGGFASSVVTVTPVSGFSAYVSLSCSGLPISTTCTFSPTNVLASCTAGAGGAETCTPVNSTLQIQTISPGGGRVNNGISSLGTGGRGVAGYAFVFPAVFGIVGLGSRRKRIFSSVAIALFVLAGALLLSSCKERYNYLNHGPPANPGTPPGTYTVTIDAVSSSGSVITRPAAAPQITLTVSSGS